MNDLSVVLDPESLAGKNIFFLQGPIGSFFRETIAVLESEYGVKRCYQLILNKGDEFFSNKSNRVPYHGELSGFSDWISEFYTQNGIDFIFLLGDSREYHKRAIQKAKEMGISVYVFEEGYIRPNYITLEEGGVNNNSALPREISFYLEQDIESLKKENEEKTFLVGPTYYPMAFSAVIYYVLMYLFNFQFKNYKHHRTRSVFLEFRAGWINYFKKHTKGISDKRQKRKIDELYGGYFFVVLQVREDFQIREHSDYRSVEHYIEDVLVSFKNNNENTDTVIVIKHHPMDRGKVDYTDFIEEVCFHIKLSKSRVIYVYDLPLPFLIKGAAGCVTINSTVGMQALHHGVPVKVMGRALYDMEGLTYQGSLDDFWKSPGQPDRGNYLHFREYLVNKTQITGSFYLSGL